jgi:hypothetical protein
MDLSSLHTNSDMAAAVLFASSVCMILEFGSGRFMQYDAYEIQLVFGTWWPSHGCDLTMCSVSSSYNHTITHGAASAAHVTMMHTTDEVRKF